MWKKSFSTALGLLLKEKIGSLCDFPVGGGADCMSPPQDPPMNFIIAQNQAPAA